MKNRFEHGLNPDELLGVGRGPSKRNRGKAARDRRAAKRSAAARGVPLKSYLRTSAKQAKA